MISLEIIGIGAAISYSMALLMKLILVFIRSFENKKGKDACNS